MAALTLTAYRIHLDDGSNYVTSMAAGVTLAMAREYFFGQTIEHGSEENLRRVVDVTEVSHKPIPADHPVQPLAPGEYVEDAATCGHCGLSWDDGVSTSMTPVPSGRCPFEYFHLYDDDEGSDD